MAASVWVHFIWSFFVECVTFVLVKYTTYGKCKSDQRLDNKVVVITGATSGLGKAVALLLAKRGAKIVMAVRNVSKAKEVVKEIRAKVSPVESIDIVEVDLASLDSVRKCAEMINKRHQRIDVLINNAGLWVEAGQKTPDGHEMHFGVNYLSHFLLTLLLLPNLKKSKNGKVINVTSSAHRLSTLDFTDLNASQAKFGGVFYGKSKLAIILFTKELAKRCPSVKTYAVYPGGVKTKIFGDKFSKLPEWFQNVVLLDPEEGAQSILHCILDPQADQESGLYYMACRKDTPSEEARNSKTAIKLWSASLELVGLQEKNLDL